MDTGWLTVFREIAHTGSFTAAAHELGYTQSAVSRQIAALEADVGATLFDRGARGVRLTEAGRYLLTHADAVLDRLSVARDDLAALRAQAVGRLRVGSFATAGAALVPGAISTLLAERPGVEIRHRDGLTRELVTQVIDGALDVAVIAGYPDRIAALPAVRLRLLCEEPVLVALPAGHRLAGRRTIRLSDLANEVWIAGSASPGETLIRATLRQGFAPRIGWVVKEWTGKLGFVAAGLGITLVPALGATGTRPDVVLVGLRPQDTPMRQIHVATAGEPTGLVRRFVDALADRITGMGL